ncbi:MAG: hypothetical protein HYZ09_02850 [Candidatus Kerfeldbacteria bacterium]|nr:hypothetical protein [Candidatus Kerfeldbacteria bacterium]
MALVQKRNTRKNLIAIIVLIVVVVGGGVAYWFLTHVPSDRQTDEFRRRDLPILTTFGEEFLSSERVQALRQYGNVPVEAEPYGNENPFLQQF